MKACGRSRWTLRHASNSFPDDFENYLEARPIRARKGDAWYRTQKFLPALAAGCGGGRACRGGLPGCDRSRTPADHRPAADCEVRQLSNKLFDIDVEVRRIPGARRPGS